MHGQWKAGAGMRWAQKPEHRSTFGRAGAGPAGAGIVWDLTFDPGASIVVRDGRIGSHRPAAVRSPAGSIPCRSVGFVRIKSQTQLLAIGRLKGER